MNEIPRTNEWDVFFLKGFIVTYQGKNIHDRMSTMSSEIDAFIGGDWGFFVRFYLGSLQFYYLSTILFSLYTLYPDFINFCHRFLCFAQVPFVDVKVNWPHRPDIDWFIGSYPAHAHPRVHYNLSSFFIIYYLFWFLFFTCRWHLKFFFSFKSKGSSNFHVRFLGFDFLIWHQTSIPCARSTRE
jgi:hypothetical protein